MTPFAAPKCPSATGGPKVTGAFLQITSATDAGKRTTQAVSATVRALAAPARKQ